MNRYTYSRAFLLLIVTIIGIFVVFIILSLLVRLVPILLDQNIVPMAAFPPPPLASLGTCHLGLSPVSVSASTNCPPRCRMEQAGPCSYGRSVTQMSPYLPS
jgi:hypothetical protein